MNIADLAGSAIAPWYLGTALAALALAGAAARLLRKVRRPPPLPMPQPRCCADAEVGTATAPRRRTLRARIEAFLDALDYLRTRREWRYRTPWILLLGEARAGKTSLAASISPRHRQAPGPLADELSVAHVTGHFLESGLLFDPQGRLPAAAGGADAATWSTVLDDIGALRPERAVDGLVLVVSARTLCGGTEEQLRAAAENILRQLDTLQQRFEFMLPVYVTVSDTDAVDGFGPFWRAQAPERAQEIFGWSAPAGAANDTPEEWADSAFDMLGERLKALQVTAAAGAGQIADADRFFLFPRQFEQLRAPLREWLALVFQPSAWRAGFLCRGIYFTGSIEADGAAADEIRRDVAFVDDLVVRKVLAEPGLARPTRQGIWSRNKLIRRLQYGGVALCAGLALWLAHSTVQLHRQLDALHDSLRMLQETRTWAAAGDACIPRESVYDMLAKVSQIDANAFYWAIPASWFDSRVTRRSAQMISDAALQRLVMPGIACRLEQRARDLSAHLPVQAGDGDAYLRARAELFDYLRAAQALEANLEHFRSLTGQGPRPPDDHLLRTLAGVAAYAYGTPVPATAKREHDALSAALAQFRYPGEPHLPLGMRERIGGQIVALNRTLRVEFDREVDAGNRLLAALAGDDEDILDDTRHFTRWLTWVRGSWLGSGATNNPCAAIRGELDATAAPLAARYGYAALAELGRGYDNAACYAPSMKTLTAMQLPPYGPLFVRRDGVLQLAPGLAAELKGLSALPSLAYMQLPSTQPFACEPAAATWRATDVGQAAGYARDYRAFARAQRTPGAAGDPPGQPLYERLALRRLEQAMNATLRNAQAGAAGTAPALMDAASAADLQLAQQSAALGAASDALLDIVNTYGQLHLRSAPRLNGCLRSQAAAVLADVGALADMSRLYEPDPGKDTFFDLGTTPVTRDYLARQVARSQVLAGYAAPYVKLLQNTPVVDDAHRPNDRSVAYWQNTIAELNRYVQFKEPAGQVAQLDDLFLKQFANLDVANCGKALDYHPADYGNDLFSQRRLRIEDQVRGRCDRSRTAKAKDAYRALAERFNRELAWRYPFATAARPDAQPETVRAFFADYAAQRLSLRQSVAGLGGAQWSAARDFLDQLDAASAFFDASFLSGDSARMVGLSVVFHALPGMSRGADQVIGWTLSSGAKAAGYPNRSATLDWPYGQAIVLDLAWANRAALLPVRDPLREAQANPAVEGATASFIANGDWALLRLIDLHRPKFAPPADPLDPNRLLLEFEVPLAGSGAAAGKAPAGTARLYLGLKLSGKDPKTQSPATLKLPDTFPRHAPL